MIALRVSTMMLVFSMCFVLVGSAGHSSFAQTNNDKRAKQLENEKKKLSRLKNPADRAQSLMKIADITLMYLRDALTTNDVAKLNECTSSYRHTVKEARDTMMNSGLDPLKKPKGYKAIELATRVHLRILEDSMRRVSADDRQALEEAIDAASKIRAEMIAVLFP